MLDYSAQCLTLLCDASLKALLLATIAAAVLKLAQVRNSNIRHRVWLGVLFGMLLLPGLSLVIPALGLPLALQPEWLFAAQDAEPGAVSFEPATEMNSPNDTSSVARSEAAPLIPSMESEGFDGAIDVFDDRIRTTDHIRSNAAKDSEFLADAEPAALRVDGPEIDPQPESASNAALVPAESVTTAAPPTLRSRLLPRFPFLLLSVWLIGGLLMGARLLAGLRMAFTLHKISTPVAGSPLSAMEEARPRVPIRQCPSIRVPLTVGAFRPQILLPPEWIEWPPEKLNSVLTHERTHVERADYAVTLLVEVNRCIYWFHPLAWWLRRQLSDLAEEACDDAAIDSTGDRIRYARHLLEVAASLAAKNGRVVSAGVSMARRSNVETRINAILDKTRPLSRRLTWATTFALVAMIVPFITLAAALRPADDASDHNLRAPASVGPSQERETADAKSETRFSERENIAIVEPVTNTDTIDGSGLELESEKNSALALAEPEPAKSGASQPDGSPTSADAPSRTVSGRVVDEGGRPLANVTLSVSPALRSQFASDDARRVEAKGTTNAEGRFLVEIAQSDPDEQETSMNLIATHTGYGITWVELNDRVGSDPIELVLHPERPIKGSFIDMEGRPVAGATVSVRGVKIAKDKGAIDRLVDGDPQNRRTNLAEIPTLTGPITDRFQVTGDDDGRFELKGIAGDTICAVDVEPANHANAEFWIVNREAFAGRGEDRPANRRGPAYMPLLVGPDFTHVLLPDMKIEGRVTAEDGQGIRDVSVGAASGAGRVWTTRTDAEGRYRLGGVARRSGILRMSVRPADESPFISRALSLDVGPEDASKTVDVHLKHGIMVSGRVIDPLTGKGMTGAVRFSPLPENEFASVPEFDGFARDRSLRPTDAKGNFRLSVIPGPGVILVQAFRRGVTAGEHHIRPFRQASFDKEDSRHVKLEHINGNHVLRVKFGQEHLKGYHAVKYVNLSTDAGPQTVDLQLSRGKTVDLEFVDSDGQPVSDVFIAGITENWPITEQLHEPRATVYGLDESRPREVLMLQEQRRLAWPITLKGDEVSPVKVTLRPAGRIRGRALDAAGEPIGNTKLTMTFRDETTRELYRFFNLKHPELKTDREGRFEYALVIPGRSLSLEITLDGKPLRPAMSKTLGPGEDLDLGDVLFLAVQRDGKPSPPAKTDGAAPQSRRETDGTSSAVTSGKSAAPASDAKVGEDSKTFAGMVVDDVGQPVTGAKVSLSYFRPANVPENSVPQAVTDEHGRFEIAWSKSEPPERAVNRGWFDIGLTATKEGFGFAYGPIHYFEMSGRLYSELEDSARTRLEEESGPKSDVLRLVRDDVPVRGRVVNLDGRPVAGAKVAIAAIWNGTDGSLDQWEANAKEQAKDPELALGWRNLRQLIAGYVAPGARMYYGGKLRFQDIQFKRGFRPIPVPVVATDAEGRFTMKGLGRERMAEFVVSGPGLETVQQRLRSRPGETITRRPPNLPVSTVYPNEFTLVVPPSVPVTGRVSDLKTGNPIAGVRVHPASSLHTGALTDAEGRYRLEGLPLGSSELYLIPPAGSRYLAGGAVVKTSVESSVVEQDVTLAAGIRAQGRLLDETTGKPVSALVSYFAYASNPQIKASDSFRQTPIETEVYPDADGHFEIPVLPGKGILGFEAGDDYPRGIGVEKIDCPDVDKSPRSVVFETVPTRCNANTQNLMIPLDPSPDLEELSVNATLSSGTSIPIILSAPDGEPIGKYFVHGERPRLPWARHSGEEFHIPGYFPTDRRRLIVYHPERNLAAHFELTGAAPEKLDIPLLRAATLAGRILDAEGEPVANATIASRPLSFQSKQGKLTEEDRERGIVPMSGSGMQLSTDAAGRFEIKGIIPGVKYTAEVTPKERDRVGNRLMRSDSVTIFTNLTAEAGETKQLGDIRIGPKDPPKEGAGQQN